MPRSPASRRASQAFVALRWGRNPQLDGGKPASKRASITRFTAICATRSRTVGIG